MFVSLTEVALSTPPTPPPYPPTTPAPTPALHSLSQFAWKQAGGVTGWMLGNRKKAATEQSRGESANAQGWSTNQKKEKKLVWGWGGTQWLGLCFGNVNEAGNFLSVWLLRVNERVAPWMCGRFVLGMPAEQRGAGPLWRLGVCAVSHARRKERDVTQKRWNRQWEQCILKLKNLSTVLIKVKKENRRISEFSRICAVEREPGRFPNGMLCVTRHVVVKSRYLLSAYSRGKKTQSRPPKNCLPTAILVGNIMQHVWVPPPAPGAVETYQITC